MLEEFSMYYVRWRGEVTGPFSGQQIRSLLEKGRLTRFHDISSDRLSWKQLQKFIEPSTSQMKATTAPQAKPSDLSTKQAQPVEAIEGEKLTGRIASAHIASTPPFLPAPPIDYAFMPIAELLKPGLFRRPVVKWVIVFCTLPLLILLAHHYLAWGFEKSAWLVEGFFCLFWAIFFFHIMQPEPVLWKTGLAFALFTAFIGIPALLLWQQIPLIKTLYAGIEGQGVLPRLLGFIFGVGLFEELCKVAPFFIINPRRYGLRTPGDGLVLGIMSGLGFALNEGVMYSIKYWQENAMIGTSAMAHTLLNFQGGPELFAQQMQKLMADLAELYGGTILSQFVRLMILPLLHAAWSGIVGYYVGYAWLRGQWGGLLMGLFLAAGLHGLYDFWGGTIYMVVMAGGSVALLLSIMVHHHRATATVASEGAY